MFFNLIFIFKDFHCSDSVYIFNYRYQAILVTPTIINSIKSEKLTILINKLSFQFVLVPVSYFNLNGKVKEWG